MTTWTPQIQTGEGNGYGLGWFVSNWQGQRLIEHGEEEATERARAAYMLVVAAEETHEMTPAEREAWLRTCDVEHDNFRAAIRTLVDSGNADWALRLSAALFRFWEQRDHLTEGRETLARVLAMPGAEAPTPQRASPGRRRSGPPTPTPAAPTCASAAAPTAAATSSPCGPRRRAPWCRSGGGSSRTARSPGG